MFGCFVGTGIALLGAGTDMNEATSLTFENDIVDVYSNSWGPFDDGSTVSGPGTLTNIALEMGTTQVCIRAVWLYTKEL